AANFNFIADQTLGTTSDDNVVDFELEQNAIYINVLASSNGTAQNDKSCQGNGAFDIWGFTLNSTLQTKDTPSTSSIKLYPNPTSNFITIENNNAEQLLSIDLLDYAGKRLRSFDPKSTSLSLAGFSPGIYLLQISTPQGNFCEQICLE
ncbi:MAG: hypothetical protein RL106_1531, partial [Bacteroidota bacterium]